MPFVQRRRLRRVADVLVVSALIGVAAALAGCGSSDSTDGIVLTSNRSGATQGYIVKPDGSGLRRITSGEGNAGAVYSPDRSRIAFSSVRDGNDEVYVMDADGGNVTRLTRDPAPDYGPSWSPDGRKILFTSIRDGDGKVFTFGPDGVKRREATSGDIYVMNADGSDQTNLTRNPAADSRARFSPDGRKIAFTTARNDFYDDVYVMNADGTGRKNLTPDAKNYNRAPSFSPDGKKIAYASERGPDFTNDVYIMNADGSGKRNLTKIPNEDVAPVFSPDGTRIAFSSRRDGKEKVWVMNADGSDPKAVTDAKTSENIEISAYPTDWVDASSG
jgi:Tol biopolymer transport system component